MNMFLKVVKYRFISGIKHPAVLICMLCALFLSAVVGVYAQKNQSESSLYPIAIVDEDGGEFAQLFIEKIENNRQVDVIFLSRDKAVKQVAVGKIDGAFILLDGFSKKISENDYEEIVEFISPTVTTSAYPVSEIVSSEIMDIWLSRLVENKLYELYTELDDNAKMSYESVIEKIDTDYISDDIISIEYIGDNDFAYKKDVAAPIDKAVGVFASFVLFAIMLSGEWIFDIKKKSLQNRFISENTSLEIVCLGSQFASVIITILFFVPLIIFLSVYLSLQIYAVLYLVLGMFIFCLCICSMAFVVSAFAENLTQLVVVGSSFSIINILISSLAMPMPDWSESASGIAKIFPGTYIYGCYDNMYQLLAMLIITIVWVGIGYIAILRLRKTSKL